MALTFFWRFQNSLTLDGTHDFTAGDSVATAVGTATFNTTQSRDGYAGYYDGPLDNHTFAPASILVRDQGSIAFWFRGSIWNDSAGLFRVYGTTNTDRIDVAAMGSSGTGNIRVRFARDGQVALSLTTTNSNFALGNWYFVVVKWDHATDLAGVWVYDTTGAAITNGNATTSSLVNATHYPSTEFTIFEVGEWAGANFDCWIDNLFIGSAYDDGDAFLTNRDITSYTSYSAGGSSVAPLAAAYYYT
jgi:hypothetical protein